MNKEAVYICRCEDVTLKDVLACIAQGHHRVEEIKRLLRLGMGPCQGNTCIDLVRKELAKALNKPINTIAIPKNRPLITGVPLGVIAKGDCDES